jgi:hypothetical protein
VRDVGCRLDFKLPPTSVGGILELGVKGSCTDSAFNGRARTFIARAPEALNGAGARPQ